MLFPTTNWKLLAEATLAGDSAGQKALAQLCQDYRQPIEQFLTARGYEAAEVEDIVQDFYLKWLKSRAWKRADPVRGRFRNYMLGAVLHLLAQRRQFQSREKRGGGQEVLSLDALAEKGEEVVDESMPADPEFDRIWARNIVSNAVASLEREMQASGRAADFAVMRQFLPGATHQMSLDEAASTLGVNIGLVKSAVFRLRSRFRELIRAAVAKTVSQPHEINEELEYLRSLLLQDRGEK